MRIPLIWINRPWLFWRDATGKLHPVFHVQVCIGLYSLPTMHRIRLNLTRFRLWLKRSLCGMVGHKFNEWNCPRCGDLQK